MEFIKGMDISTLPEMLDLGFVYKDENGNPAEPFQLLKDNGVNSIRLRIWNEPQNEPKSGGYCNLKDTVMMAKKIKEYGMSFFLDFHYSDWWADPGQQRKPKAWENLAFPELCDALHDFTYEVLCELEKENCYPDFVQIGNEIRSGMLFPDGDARNFPQLAALVNSGIRAVREMDEKRKGLPSVKLVIHLDQGGRYRYFEDWFDKAIANGVTDFDIIALSYYPFWHGTFTEFRDCMTKLIARYKKPVMAAETAHAWRMVKDGFVSEQQERIAGFPATPAGQRQVVEMVMNIVAAQPDGKGIGAYYWEPLDIPRPGIDGWPSNMGIIAPDCRPMEALKAFHFRYDPARNGDIIKMVSVCGGKEENEEWSVVSDSWSMLDDRGIGRRCQKTASREAIRKLFEETVRNEETATVAERLLLPQKGKVLCFDGSCKETEILWTGVTAVSQDENVSELMFTGTVPSSSLTVTYILQLAEAFEEAVNYLTDGGFAEGMGTWKAEASDVRYEIRTTADTKKEEKEFYFEGDGNFVLRIEHEVTLPEPGRYCFRLQYLGTNTTGTEVNMYAVRKTNAGEKHYVEWIYPQDKEWLDYEICGIETETPGELLTVGLEVKAPPVNGRVRRMTVTRE